MLGWQFPLLERGWAGTPKNLRFWRASLHPYFATKSRTMGWQRPKNHPFWTFLECILVGPWFCKWRPMGAPTLSKKCTKPYILGRVAIWDILDWLVNLVNKLMLQNQRHALGTLEGLVKSCKTCQHTHATKSKTGHFGLLDWLDL